MADDDYENGSSHGDDEPGSSSGEKAAPRFKHTVAEFEDEVIKEMIKVYIRTYRLALLLDRRDL